MLPAEILKAYRASTKTEFMWLGEKNLVPYFSIHIFLSTL